MVKPLYSNTEIQKYVESARTILKGKNKTSSKKLSKVLGITPAMTVRILWRLGWYRHRRNGSSGTVYFRKFDKGDVL